MMYLIALLWLILFTKKLFFWVYLWQLKEYHIGRFLDHFRTAKGKKLIFNYLLPVKILVLLGIIYSARAGLAEVKFSLLYFVIFIFSVEALFSLRHFWRKTFKRPVITRKTLSILNTGISFGLLVLFFSFLLQFKLTRLIALLLLLDILIPVGFSLLVLAFQPLAVFLRRRIIKRAKEKRARFNNLLVIGLTGSYGKTSTKEYLASILSERFRVLKTKEHQNSEVGISECILDHLRPEHQIFVCEMGAYNRGGIKLLCDIVKPQIGILTGINEQHMATFGSQENIIKTKYELIESLPQNGIAFFNANNKYCLELYEKTNIRKKLYGQGAAVFPQKENLAAAKMVAQELGLSQEEIARSCKDIKPWPELRLGINGINIIDATYSANPTGIMADLDYLTRQPGKKVIVMPCLIELGKASKEVHRRIGKRIDEVCDLAILTTKDRFKEIKEGAPNVLLIENPKEIAKKIKEFCQPGDVVLLESRVPLQLINFLIK